MSEFFSVGDTGAGIDKMLSEFLNLRNGEQDVKWIFWIYRYILGLVDTWEGFRRFLTKIGEYFSFSLDKRTLKSNYIT